MIIYIELTALIISAAYLFVGIKNMVQWHYSSALSLILIIPILTFSFALLSWILTLGHARRDGIYLVHAHDIDYYNKFTSNEKQYLDTVKLTQPDDRGFRY